MRTGSHGSAGRLGRRRRGGIRAKRGAGVVGDAPRIWSQIPWLRQPYPEIPGCAQTVTRAGRTTPQFCPPGQNPEGRIVDGGRGGPSGGAVEVARPREARYDRRMPRHRMPLSVKAQAFVRHFLAGPPGVREECQPGVYRGRLRAEGRLFGGVGAAPQAADPGRDRRLSTEGRSHRRPSARGAAARRLFRHGRRGDVGPRGGRAEAERRAAR